MVCGSLSSVASLLISSGITVVLGSGPLVDRLYDHCGDSVSEAIRENDAESSNEGAKIAGEEKRWWYIGAVGLGVALVLLGIIVWGSSCLC